VEAGPKRVATAVAGDRRPWERRVRCEICPSSSTRTQAVCKSQFVRTLLTWPSSMGWMETPTGPGANRGLITFPAQALLILEERLAEQEAEGVEMPEGMERDELALRILVAAEMVRP
jgi:hypothetical protein